MKLFEVEIKSKNDLNKLISLLPDRELMLIAKEAGLNVLKHTSGGICKFFKVKNGYKIVFEDFDGEIDIKKAFLKGYSSSNTLGIGLNLIINLVDEFEIIPKKDGKIFVFVVSEKKEYCVFVREYEDLSAFFKVNPYLTITTNGDCGLFEKVGERYFFAIWDIVGHGNRDVYLASKKLKKFLFGFRYFDLEDVIEVTRYLYDDKDAALVVGNIKEKIEFFRFGNIRYFYKEKAFYEEAPFFKGDGVKEELLKDDIIFFSDGVDINKMIYSMRELEDILRNKKEDDACAMVIRM